MIIGSFIWQHHAERDAVIIIASLVQIASLGVLTYALHQVG